jgi:hypothetical protein
MNIGITSARCCATASGAALSSTSYTARSGVAFFHCFTLLLTVLLLTPLLLLVVVLVAVVAVVSVAVMSVESLLSTITRIDVNSAVKCAASSSCVVL